MVGDLYDSRLDPEVYQSSATKLLRNEMKRIAFLNEYVVICFTCIRYHSYTYHTSLLLLLNKERFVSKLFLRGDSVILIVSNPAALAAEETKQ